MLAPTLLVGLGGTGSGIVKRVADMVTPQQRQRISFIAVDTDVNELNDIRAGSSFIRTVQTSTKMSVGEYLNIDTHARDEWFPVNAVLNRKTLTEGAGQVRAISRLALDTAIRAGNLEPLDEAIESLYKLEGEQSTQALRVIIASSLAGGTGSGLILPIAMYIRNFLQTRLAQSASIARGFFILPEVFYQVIQGQAERNNLKSNAYATIRELDAFLMKGDGGLPRRYADTLKLEFPRVGSEEVEEYNVMPFDFCFLYDAQNVDGNRLNSYEDYLQHAASCIYAQSIGPMNKRSNSSEDNTIKEIVSAGGRNRYAGAGSSMLIYPVEDVRDFVAMRWADTCISGQWLTFDEQHKEKARQNQDKRARGISVRDLPAAQDYIASVEAGAANKDAFATAIRTLTSNFSEDGLTRVSDKWEDYMLALRTHVANLSSAGQRDLDDAKREAKNSVGELAADVEAYVDAWGELEHYKNLVVRRTEETASTIAFTMFQTSDEGIISDSKKHQLEAYLRDETKQFMHPNAVRYFLYKVHEMMESEKRRTKSANDDAMQYFETAEIRFFDDPSTQDVEEVAADITSRKKSLVSRVLRRPDGWQEELKGNFGKYVKYVDDYRVSAVYEQVLDEGMKYVKSLSDAFEIFYSSFDSSVDQVKDRISRMVTKYEDIKGSVIRYVCASRRCFESFDANFPYEGNALSLDSELCERIYSKVRRYAMLKEKANESYFRQLFEEDILGYFREAVMLRHGGAIRMDIIDALMKEVEFEKKTFDRGTQEDHVHQVIQQARHLSSPFIEQPSGEQRHPVPACAFNPKLRIANNPARVAFVDAELMNDGGVEDEEIPESVILFYKAIYGLRANELGKFAPPTETATLSRDAGEYYKAYFELISRIKPKSEETRYITPHIDRRWHLARSLPDLDEKNQERQEDQIFLAFFLALVYAKVRLIPVANNKLRYRLFLNSSSEDMPEDFVVSNGTPCDCFYEVLDALQINPIAVKGVLAEVKADIDREKLDNRKHSLKSSPMMRMVEELAFTEFADIIPVEPGKPHSIFDIPTFLKISAPADFFRDEDGTRLLRVMLNEIYSYISDFSDEEERDSDYADFILKQYDLFKPHIEKYTSEWPVAFNSYIVKLMDQILRNFRKHDLDDAYAYISEEIDSYTRDMEKRFHVAGARMV